MRLMTWMRIWIPREMSRKLGADTRHSKMHLTKEECNLIRKGAHKERDLTQVRFYLLY